MNANNPSMNAVQVGLCWLTKWKTT